MNMVNFKIDGIPVSVPAGTTILEAAKQAGIKIPTLCYMKDINEIGACRMCVVEAGGRALQAACVYPVEALPKNRVTGEVVEVKTNTPAIRKARRVNLELLLSNHDKRCLSCVRSTNCELQALCREYGVEDEARFAGPMTETEVDNSSVAIVRNNAKCVLCRRCVAVCNKVQSVGVIGPVKRGFKTQILPAWNMGLAETGCINCGQCIAVCPTGALTEKDDTAEVFEALSDPDKYVVVQPAPAVRAALGEEFGIPMGTSVTGKMAAALRRLGFKKVFDTDFAADLTIMEEATELVGRVNNGGVLPMITSCSPGWIKFCETYYPEFIPNLSSCKSPHEMEGAVIKSYFAEKEGIDPEKIGEVVGPRGKMINKIIEETGVKIDIEDDGSVYIATNDDQAAQRAKSIIEGIVRELQVGDVFVGKVVRIMSFGAFVEYAPGKDGMIHISKLANERVEKVEDVVNIGDTLECRVAEIDAQGRINLLRNDIVYDDESMPVRRPPRRDGDRGDRGGRGPRRG